MKTIDVSSLAQMVREGHTRALARALSMVENGSPSSESILHELYDPDRTSVTIGITGPPGAGKSTLTSMLISHLRDSGRRVGVIAVDPSSPFSGGALLGDRVRMQDHASDQGVFIRSMGSRGHLGGLSGASRDALEIMTAASFDPVIVETVGVGQGEVEIVTLADVTILVLVPGLGDEVQTMKAGIMEIGDIIVLNKSDRPGIDHLEASVRSSLELVPKDGRLPEVIRCSSVTGEGVVELSEAIDRFVCSDRVRSDAAERRTSLILGEIIRERGQELAEGMIAAKYGSIEKAVESILGGETTPWKIGQTLCICPEEMQEKD